MLESARGLQWLRTTLAADSTVSTQVVGGIWRAYAPIATTPPYIILAHQGGSDVKGAPQYRLLDSSLYQVKVVGKADTYQTLITIADAMDAALERQSGSTSDSIIYFCTREQPLEVDELSDGLQYSSIGGMYRLLISASA